jgi:hypothetical protein
MIVGQEVKRHRRDFCKSSSSVGASAAAGISSQCPAQTAASSSHFAEIVKMSGLAISDAPEKCFKALYHNPRASGAMALHKRNPSR